jgi:hypothetical protein
MIYSNILLCAVTSVLILLLLLILFHMLFKFLSSSSQNHDEEYVTESWTPLNTLKTLLFDDNLLTTIYEDEDPEEETNYITEGGDFTNAEPSTSATHDMASSQLTADPGAPKGVTNYLQTQVAAEIIELTTLKKDIFDEHYSTPMYRGQKQVTSTNVVNDVVCQEFSNLIITNNNYKRMFIDKRFASYDVRYTINVTGNPMATGLVAFANIPMGQPLPTSYRATDPTSVASYTQFVQRVLALDHILVDLSVDGVYTIDMPWTYYRTYLSTFDYTTATPYAQMVGVVLSPLLPAIGAPTSVNFEVYATMMNLQFDETAPYMAQGLFSFGETNNISYNLDNIRDSTLPINVTGDSLSASATVPFGFDNPSDTRNPPSILNTFFQKIVSVKNALNVFRASIEPAKMEVFNQHRMEEYRIPEDEMALSYFNGRWAPESYYQADKSNGSSLAAPFAITPSTTSNSVLFWAYLAPTGIPQSGALTTSTYTSDFRNVITANALYWRGSLKYRLCIAGNSFKRGKLLVAINYCPETSKFLYSGTITTGELDPRSLPHIIIDLSSEDRYVDIEVPYKSINQVSRTVAMNVDLGDVDPINEFMIGQLLVCLVSPLQVSNGTATTINLSLLSSWGDDMKFYVKPGTSRHGPVTEALLCPESRISTREHSLSAIAHFNSLKELLLQPVHYGTYYIPYQQTSENLISLPVHPQFLSSSPEWSAMMSMYCGCKGSFRLVARVVSTTGPIKITVWPYTYFPRTSKADVITAKVFNDTGNADNTQVAMLNYIGSRIPATNILNSVIAPGYQATATNSQVHCILNNVQPEGILEFPDSAPLYKTQPCDIMPRGYAYSRSYYPEQDRSVPWITMNMVDAPNVDFPAGQFAASVALYFIAGDDFRFFWYNGGPTKYGPNNVATTVPSTISAPMNYP